MKLVSDKPTKSFRLLGFLSLSFSFSLSLSLSFFSCLLLPYSLSFSIFLFTSIRTFLLDPFPFLLLSPYSSISAFLQIFSFFFFFANYNRGEEKRERKKGKERGKDSAAGEGTSPRDKRGAILLFFLSLPACEQFSFPSGDKVPFDSFPRICLISPISSRVL